MLTWDPTTSSIRDEEGYLIAAVHGDGIDGLPDADALGQAFAAVPQLLAALEKAVAEGSETDCIQFGADSSCGTCWVCIAHAALHAAKGAA